MSQAGKKIRHFRIEKKMSVEELALRIRCGTKTLENYENGTITPNLQTILKISTALDIPASELTES